MNDPHSEHKSRIAPLRRALYNFEGAQVALALRDLFAPDAQCHICHPFGTIEGPEALYDMLYAPLCAALPDLEFRDAIVMAGLDDHGHDWVGCSGHIMGTFSAPWLDIPATGHVIHMRYHEFYRFKEGRVVEVQAIWDIPELMMQARAWPMVPSLGREMCVPCPAPQNGHVPPPWDAEHAEASKRHITAMLHHMIKFPGQGGPEVMEMPRFWHPKMNWYGPAGIGTARGISGFRKWHQTPFLNAMPDRGQFNDQITFHFFGDGDFAAVTGWPNMIQTITGDGWLGIAPAGQSISLRSLDFWRLEEGLIRENWVLIDLLDIYSQVGIDVLARMRALTAAGV